MEKTVTGITEEAVTLQKYLQRQLGLTRRQISQAKFRPGGILVNGCASRVNRLLQPGDCVKVLLEEAQTASGHLVPADFPLDIRYEDEDLLAVNKPAGLVVHPSHGHYGDTLANAVQNYYLNQKKSVKIRPLGRLDKETSGIVLFAKNQAAAARLAGQKAQGIFRKEYLAIVYGCPDPASGTIDLPIAKDEQSLLKMKIDPSGKPAVTHYRTLASAVRLGPVSDPDACPAQAGKRPVISLVELHLETGRTHQIRLHMAAIGHPLVGDQIYGPDSENSTGASTIGRAALHAARCILRQPFDGQEILIEAELPADMQQMGLSH